MSSSIKTLVIIRNLSFGMTGLLLVASTAFVLFVEPEKLRYAIWSSAFSVGLFAVMVAVSIAADRRGNRILWDETARFDYNQSLQWAYFVTVFIIFPVLTIGIFLGLDPLRAFISAALLAGAIQLLLFCILDWRGR
ncbi:hypothetical protein [Hoeflea sp.]|uniref:hypothetical protein n=1 Tax=Hoeflea sp. TaxID=1940281 RepID=UPI003B023E6E